MNESQLRVMQDVLVGEAAPAIIALEARLRLAQLDADVGALAELLSDDLLFTGPDGQLGTKAQDIAAHASGVVRVREHLPEELRVRPVGRDVAVVALRVRLAVEVPGSLVRGTFRSQPETTPGHDYFGQIVDTDGTVLLCLHRWGAHEHPSLMSQDDASPGNGLLLFFRVDDYAMALTRARGLVARLEEEPHLNPSTQTGEFSLRDPDGYYVTISALSMLVER